MRGLSAVQVVRVLLLLAFVSGCEIPPNACLERVCKPTWAGDCRCNPGERVVELKNGNVKCECPKGEP